MAFASVKNKKVVQIILFCLCFLMLALVVRLFYLQVIKGDYYEEKAYKQQTRDRSVAATRGTIYDATGEKKLAQSISTNTVSVVPNDIENKEQVAKDLAEILELEEDDVLAKLNKRAALVTIKTKVDEEVATAVYKYVMDNEINGIKVDESTKRIYQYNNLLSHVLGFTGTDGQGLYGLELQYDEELSGVPGKIVGSADGKGRETPYKEEQYVEPINGYDLVLTVDATIQGIVEKNLAKAVKENEANYGAIIMMRPKTGEILAMATYPDFDPNNAFEPNTEELIAKWDSMSTSEKSTALNDIWRNKAISNTAEPGSTFKIVTSSAVLEEGLVDIDQAGAFNCAGAMKIGGWTIRCWRHPRTHGVQSLRQGIMNSCNPVFMQSALKIGIDKYCEYLEAFNLKDKTGIDLPGEVGGILHDPKTMTEVDLATTGFGQTFQITPLQSLVTAAAVANGGEIVTPYVVSEIRTSDGSIVSKTEPKIKKRVISQETAASILDALYSTVEEGTGKAAKVRGYSVAGKTGTGEQGRGSSLWYMASFVGIAPVTNPEICIIFNLYNPTGPQGHQGGTVCAPVVSNIIDETLRYLDVSPDYTLEENNIEEILVPNLTGKTYSDAEKSLKEIGFSIASDSKFEADDLIVDQTPKVGASLISGSTIRVYRTEDKEKITVTVPDVRDMTVAKATTALKKSGLNIRIIGNGNGIIQDPSPGDVVQKGSIVTVKFVDTTDLH